MYSEEQKQQVYKRWLDNGRPWFHIDKSKEPTYYEKQIIMEMKKKEAGIKSKRTSPKPVNEIKAFDRLINQVADY